MSPKLKEPLPEKLSARVSASLHTFFTEEAERNRVSVATLVRWALEDYAEAARTKDAT